MMLGFFLGGKITLYLQITATIVDGSRDYRTISPCTLIMSECSPLFEYAFVNTRSGDDTFKENSQNVSCYVLENP
jgi:hypothetical protein